MAIATYILPAVRVQFLTGTGFALADGFGGEYSPCPVYGPDSQFVGHCFWLGQVLGLSFLSGSRVGTSPLESELTASGRWFVIKDRLQPFHMSESGTGFDYLRGGFCIHQMTIVKQRACVWCACSVSRSN